jgi:hypothetical protein
MTEIERMAEAYQNSKAKNMGALEWWQLHTPDKEGFTDAMLDAVRLLLQLSNEEQPRIAHAFLRSIIDDHLNARKLRDG